MKQIKDKNCKWCGTVFRPYMSADRFCSTYCFVDAHKDKVWRKIAKEKKAKLKSRLDYLKDLQKIFNKYIRLRDKDLPCISCKRFDVEEFHAGHYIPSTYSYLRINEDNVNKQCSYCNTHLRGAITDYRINLIKKIGLTRVEYLENSKHKSFELSIEEIKLKIEYYKKICKELK